MVGRWGMSDAVGPIAVTDGRQDGPLLPGAEPASETTQELVDKEVHRIVDESEREVIELLERERDRLEALATACSTARRSTSRRPTRWPACGWRRPTRRSRRRPRQLRARAQPQDASAIGRKLVVNPPRPI